ncbi:uncharacterized protein BKCO1_1500069 [Diplodia corticola]|uniref:Uncharacterized protein n=1 Tax=Diplodia corticola TaxID=236234 RepID=A0A1J9S5G6_9PEZI|nr:uncharacterized protein BKCO1_1500069 [Diplodia corticola]OJD35759.1 hypothetical protein BKCO1_1500069 [Diplodia corticola]
MSELEPPRKSVELQDPGAHELESSDGDDHFSDASEGNKSSADRSSVASPVPVTRVEKIDDEPSYGEVPGTSAYNMRTQDAVPDEVEIVPEGGRSRSTSRLSVSDRPTTPLSPGGTPIPKTVVEKVDDTPSYGEVPGTAAYASHQADAVPDVVLKAPEPPKGKLTRVLFSGFVNEPLTGQGSPTASDRSDQVDETLAAPAPANDDKQEEDMGTSQVSDPDQETTAADDNHEFGDDFDDFEEGGEEDFGDDFGDFDDGFQNAEDETANAFEEPAPLPPVSDPLPSLPIPSFDDLDSLADIVSASQPFVDKVFESSFVDRPTIEQEVNPSLLSERSLSLWAQLVAPPPLQPPNWVRSRIRRLFLVSLGVPVDLDEILPASKQKKLVLPSVNIPGDRSPRVSSDDRTNGTVARLKKEDNDSSTSVNSSSSKTERKRRGPPPPPEFDITAVTMLCSTTDAALQNFTAGELEAHVRTLQGLQRRANEVLDYWTKRKESAIGDKEAFEGVIENLVKHAKKVRK